MRSCALRLGTGQQAVEPLAGERLGNVSKSGSDKHSSRLGPDYFTRQQRAADEVAAARARLDEAYRLRNELRE